MKSIPYVLFTLIICSGCTKSLYMSSYTRVGIDASADGIGIGAKNATINTAPTKSTGEAFNVLGTVDLDIKYTGVILKEVVATGKASECAAYVRPSVEALSNTTKFLNTLTAQEKGKPNKLYFGTYTSWSLIDLSWRQATGSGLNFGYKRGVGLKMPIKDDNIGSVYADISLNTTDQGDDISKSKINGYRSIQTFATGQPAIIKASLNSEKLTQNAKIKGCLPEVPVIN